MNDKKSAPTVIKNMKSKYSFFFFPLFMKIYRMDKCRKYRMKKEPNSLINREPMKLMIKKIEDNTRI